MEIQKFFYMNFHLKYGYGVKTGIHSLAMNFMHLLKRTDARGRRWHH